MRGCLCVGSCVILGISVLVSLLRSSGENRCFSVDTWLVHDRSYLPPHYKLITSIIRSDCAHQPY